PRACPTRRSSDLKQRCGGLSTGTIWVRARLWLIEHDSDHETWVISRSNTGKCNPVGALGVSTGFWVYLLRGAGLAGKLVSLNLIAHRGTVLDIRRITLEGRAEHIHDGSCRFWRDNLSCPRFFLGNV